MAFVWLTFNILSIVILAFYSMLEMACVSFNKVRLHFYISQGIKRASWLSDLLMKPARLFGTTLIGVNVAMFVGSECAREFHKAIGLDPNLAPLTQVLIVVIFGELAPMFAARHYPEHVALLGVPIIYVSSKLLAPIIWIIRIVAKVANTIMGGKEITEEVYLSQEELQKILEEQDEEIPHEQEKETINIIASNIFRLKKRNVQNLMDPIDKIPLLPSQATCQDMINLLEKNCIEFVPIYHLTKKNIIGIVRPRNIIKAAGNKRVRDFSETPWFITVHTKMTDVLRQFKKSNENIAVVLDERGKSVGIVTLDSILQDIFGKPVTDRTKSKSHKVMVLKDMTFPGTITIKEINEILQFKLTEDADPDSTLSELVIDRLGHPPEKGDTLTIGNVDITVKETTFLEIKTLTITTKPM